jgi:hypothetical protein
MPVTQEFFRTDRRYRTRLFISYGAALLLLALFFRFGLPPFLAFLRGREIPAFLMITEICVMVFLLSFIVPALYLIYIGKKILHFGQVPYPGMKVIRDTKVIFGSKAVFRGKILIFLGILSIALAIAGSIASHYYFEKFRHFNPFTSPERLALVQNPHIFP